MGCGVDLFQYVVLVSESLSSYQILVLLIFHTVLCPTLPDPANGDVSVQSRTVGGTATYTCSTGYTLSGSSTRTCQTNGVWSGTAPTCNAVQCPELPQPSGGTVRLISRTPGSGIAVYRCNTGNNLIGSSFLFCQIDGTWNGNAPTCQGDCEALS